MPAHQRRQTDKQAKLIASISDAVKHYGPLRTDAQFQHFCTDYYRDVAMDDVADNSASSLAHAALAHLRQARRLAPGEHDLRVYNPDAKHDGWQSRHTIVSLVHENMPFLVDSLTMALDRLGCSIELTIHPLIRVQRTAKGTLQRLVNDAESSGHIESFIRFDIRRESRPDRIAAIEAALEATLTDVRAAVADVGEDLRGSAERDHKVPRTTVPIAVPGPP